MIDDLLNKTYNDQLQCIRIMQNQAYNFETGGHSAENSTFGEWTDKEKKNKMKLSLRIPLPLTIIVVVTGIIAFLRIMAKASPFPTSYFIIWIIGSVILIGITVWSWLRNKKK